MYMLNLTRDWTVDDALELPSDANRYEVIDGELLVTPAPALLHQRAVVELLVMLREYVRREQVGEVLAAPADIIFSRRRLVQPDVFVAPLVNGARPRGWTEVKTLVLAIEVLSPSTARADRVRKRTLFREEGVPDYWIVDLDARTIERSTPDEPRPDVIADRLVWHPAGAATPLVLDVAAYFDAILGG